MARSKPEKYKLYYDINYLQIIPTQRGLNIIGKRSKLEVRRNFYSQRVVDSWNGLFVETKLAINVAEFKWRLRAENRH